MTAVEAPETGGLGWAEVEAAFDPAYWLHLLEGIEGDDGQIGRSADDDLDFDLACDDFGRHRSCALPAALSRPAVDRARRIVERVVAHGWHPTFAFVASDALWTLIGADAPTRRIAEALLDGPVALRSNLAVHLVPPTPGAQGWPPHHDGYGAAGHLTTWIALSDATLRNGCMYVVRSSDRIRASTASFVEGTLRAAEVQHLLQAARALPAVAGTVLAWDFDVLHWGSVSEGSSDGARMSVAYEWVAASTPSLHGVGTVDLGDDGVTPPPLLDRLDMVCRSIVKYGRFDVQGSGRVDDRPRRILQRLASDRR